MQIPTKPSSLKDIPLEIGRFNAAQVNLYQCQEEYKKKVGLSGHTRNSLPFHPKALETELRDIKEHFNHLSSNYVEFLAKEKFLQCILQEPPLEITELDRTLAEEKAFKNELDHYLQQVDKVGQQIAMLAQSIEHTRSKALASADEVTNILDEITLMEEEILRIDSIVSKQSHRTIKEAKSQLTKQTQDITRLNKIMLEKKDSIADRKWQVEDLEAEVEELQSRADKAQAEADNAVLLSRRRDERVEKKYNEYIEITNLCNQLFGVDKIEFVSNSQVRIVFTKPKSAILHVEIDIVKNKIHNVQITGTIVPIQDFVNVAKQTTANEGIRIITLETLARLRKL